MAIKPRPNAIAILFFCAHVLLINNRIFSKPWDLRASESASFFEMLDWPPPRIVNINFERNVETETSIDLSVEINSPTYVGNKVFCTKDNKETIERFLIVKTGKDDIRRGKVTLFHRGSMDCYLYIMDGSGNITSYGVAGSGQEAPIIVDAENDELEDPNTDFVGLSVLNRNSNLDLDMRLREGAFHREGQITYVIHICDESTEIPLECGSLHVGLPITHLSVSKKSTVTAQLYAQSREEMSIINVIEKRLLSNEKIGEVEISATVMKNGVRLNIPKTVLHKVMGKVLDNVVISITSWKTDAPYPEDFVGYFRIYFDRLTIQKQERK